MLLLGFLLLVVSLTPGEAKNYDFTMYKHILKKIDIIQESPDLDLSNLGLIAVEHNVFHRLSHLKTLNLANNSLNSLPQDIFSNLSNLEHLDLADNYLLLGNFYNGLRNLKTLNISNNPLSIIKRGHFYGLTRFANIMTKGINFEYITSGLFENSSTVNNRPTREIQDRLKDKIHDVTALKYNKKPKRDQINITRRLKRNAIHIVTVCIKDGNLKAIKYTNENENLDNDCYKMFTTADILSLPDSSIETFENGWYYDPNNLSDINLLHLDHNMISKLTDQLLSCIRSEADVVNLEGNSIERLERSEIKNKYRIDWLNLNDNNISEIEDNALENIDIGKLSLAGNQLNNTKFLDTLSSNISDVSLANNKISEISIGNFSKFPIFSGLNLNRNMITEAKSQSLHNFSSLTLLDLSKNRLWKIEPGFFQDMKNLRSLWLSSNDISSLERGVFNGLEKITHIYLDSNKLIEVPSGIFSQLPLGYLDLSYNLIESLKAGDFVNADMMYLFLNENRIVNIEKGSFNLPNLRFLFLNDNFLTEMDGDSFEGLEKLSILSLMNNNITTIKKGATKYLNNHPNLVLSYNPIKILKNGAFFGTSKADDTYIHLYNAPIEVIQGGLFDDV